MADNIITLGGLKLRLTRPKGREGRKLVLRVQDSLRIISPAMRAAEKGGGDEMMDVLIDISDRLFSDEKLLFEDDILPSLLVYSDAGMNHGQAIEFLNQMDDPPVKIMMEYMTAIRYWMGLNADEEEALEDAAKKSRPGRKAKETPEP